MSGYCIHTTFSCSCWISMFASWEKGYMWEVMLCATSPILCSVTNSHKASGGPALRISSGRWLSMCPVRVIVAKIGRLLRVGKVCYE